MADNVAITAGSGTSVATDDVSGAHYQRVKITDGTADSSTHLKVVAGSTSPQSTDTAAVVVMRPDTVNANGQASMANSSPVVIASDQSAVASKGDVAHDGADSGNPVKIGGYATTAVPTAVASGDRVNAIFDKFGRQVITAAPREIVSKGTATCNASTSEQTIVSAGGSGVYLDLIALTITNTDTTGGVVEIRDVSAGSVVLYFYAPAQQTVGVTLPVAFNQTTANSAWTAKTPVASAAAIYVTGVFLQNK